KEGDKLVLYGVLDQNERDLLIEMTAPESYQKLVKELQKKSEEIDGEKVKSVTVVMETKPPGFDMTYAELKKTVVSFEPSGSGGRLIAHTKLAHKEVKALLVAGGDREF